MLEVMSPEAQEERRVISKAFRENLQLMRESFMVIFALGTTITTPANAQYKPQRSCLPCNAAPKRDAPLALGAKGSPLHLVCPAVTDARMQVTVPPGILVTDARGQCHDKPCCKSYTGIGSCPYGVPEMPTVEATTLDGILPLMRHPPQHSGQAMKED